MKRYGRRTVAVVITANIRGRIRSRLSVAATGNVDHATIGTAHGIAMPRIFVAFSGNICTAITVAVSVAVAENVSVAATGNGHAAGSAYGLQVTMPL